MLKDLVTSNTACNLQQKVFIRSVAADALVRISMQGEGNCIAEVTV